MPKVTLRRMGLATPSDAAWFGSLFGDVSTTSPKTQLGREMMRLVGVKSRETTK